MILFVYAVYMQLCMNFLLMKHVQQFNSDPGIFRTFFWRGGPKENQILVVNARSVWWIYAPAQH